MSTSAIHKGVSHTPRMLLVDDDYRMLRINERVARSLQLDVTATVSALDALERVRCGERFDVLVSDLDMLELRGTDLAARLADVGFVLPTLFVSGRSRIVKLLPNQRWLAKPFTRMELALDLLSLGVRVPATR
jgi:CheY-like chemotaxis protein